MRFNNFDLVILLLHYFFYLIYMILYNSIHAMHIDVLFKIDDVFSRNILCSCIIQKYNMILRKCIYYA